MTAMQSGSVPPPQATPPITTPPVVSAPTMAAGIEATHGPVDTPANTSGAPPASTGTTGPVAPTVVTAGPVAAPAAPVVGGSAVPAGPLPAYGSDLRPPVVAAPAVPSVPTAPVSGAPVAPSASSAPSAGGALVSPVERAASKAVAGQAGASSSTMAGASALSATAGATAGAVSARAAEQQRLQRIVDAVARQEPRISWAAGLRDDGTTTLLVTDLAGGWIPPHVRLPANVTLLEPTARRRDADVIDLLGAVVAVAAHESNTYVAEPGPDAPALTGDRSARSAIPKVDEFGPTLVEAVRRAAGGTQNRRAGKRSRAAARLHHRGQGVGAQGLSQSRAHRCRGLDAAGGDRGTDRRAGLPRQLSPGLVCRNHQAWRLTRVRCLNRCPKLPDHHTRPDTVS